MKKLEQGDLTITVEHDRDETKVTWLGTSSAREPSKSIDPFLDNVINESDSQALTVDFRQLEYMNSSTVKPIIRMMKVLNEHKMRSTVVYDKSQRWQHISFKALKSLSEVLEFIDVDGR